jgi:hypothetical protein
MEYRNSAWKNPELIPPSNVRRIRLKPAHGCIPYGESKQTVTKRKTVCRACGQAMLKGEPRITFMWDFKGCGCRASSSALIQSLTSCYRQNHGTHLRVDTSSR